MEFQTIAGLPAHPLFVHLPVVLIPLAGLFAIVFAFRAGWLDRFGWGLVALSGVGMIGAILAAGSGEALEEMMEDRGETISATLEEHAELGELARTISIVFFLVVLAVVVARHLARKNAGSTSGIARIAGSKGGAIAMSALLALSAAGATYTVAVAGHEGAEAVWEDEYGTPDGDEGDEDEEYDTED